MSKQKQIFYVDDIPECSYVWYETVPNEDDLCISQLWGCYCRRFLQRWNRLKSEIMTTFQSDFLCKYGANYSELTLACILLWLISNKCNFQKTHPSLPTDWCCCSSFTGLEAGAGSRSMMVLPADVFKNWEPKGKAELWVLPSSVSVRHAVVTSKGRLLLFVGALKRSFFPFAIDHDA